MGATICDTILQAGMNYRTVVAPRIRRVILRWPTATVTSKFFAMISRFGLNDILLWKDTEKPTRIGKLTELLIAHKLETEQNLSNWIAIESNCQELREVRGIGPKTVDYLKSLVGIPAVAVDRHVRTFVKLAGIKATTYEDIQDIVVRTADKMSIARHAFDHAIWSYVSNITRYAA